MRAENKNTEMKFDMLLKHLLAGNRVSVADIMEMLHCNRQSAYNYKLRLEEAITGSGYVLHTEKEGRTVFFSLINKNNTDTALDNYAPMSFDTIRKYTIAQSLSLTSLSRAALLEQFDLGHSSVEDVKIGIDIGRTNFIKYVNELIAEGEIRMDTESKKLQLTGNNIPLVLSINETELFEIMDLFENTSPGSPYYEPLHSVYRKLQLQLGAIDADSPTFHNYLLYGRQHNALAETPAQLAKILELKYQTNVLTISYRRKNRPSLFTLQLAIGLIVYSEDKDLFYMIGKTYNTRNGKFSDDNTIIPLASVEEVSEENITHTFYESPAFMQLYKEMFSVSTDAPKKVVVKFRCFPNLERKVRILASHRPGSTLEETVIDDEFKILTYTDYIRGLDDFAAFLRQFSWSAEVIEPPALREKMKASFSRSLNFYKEVTDSGLS